jgi:hypothetical protein
MKFLCFYVKRFADIASDTNKYKTFSCLWYSILRKIHHLTMNIVSDLF